MLTQHPLIVILQYMTQMRLIIVLHQLLCSEFRRSTEEFQQCLLGVWSWEGNQDYNWVGVEEDFERMNSSDGALGLGWFSTVQFRFNEFPLTHDAARMHIIKPP